MIKTVSYIFPIYNESENIDLLYKTMNDLLRQHAAEYLYELIFVNDGSTDDSLQKLLSLEKQDDRITVINFARNFGHQLAVTAGLDFAKGDAVIIMDSDMQDPPRVSFELLDKWKEGYDVVYAQRRTRKDTFFKRVTADIFYRVLQKLSDIDIPRNTGDFRLVDRKVVTALSAFREHNRFLRGLVSYVGFKQIAVEFDRDERNAGASGYPLHKMIKFALDGILSFSWTPLKLISRMGFGLAALSFVGICYAVGVKLMNPAVAVPGWTFTVIAILLIGGLQLNMLGVLASYVGRIYTEAQNRPLYIIESITTKDRQKLPFSIITAKQSHAAITEQ
ncbi:MAG: putative glycosyltransferase [Candidatus Saccharibacteria bacterium]|nr:putative glycosyltransferase [Candidatus Saccharibacteria bacterium]